MIISKKIPFLRSHEYDFINTEHKINDIENFKWFRAILATYVVRAYEL